MGAERCSLRTEEILVQPLELHRPIAADADAVLDHQIGQFLPVGEDHPLRQMPDEVVRRLAERGSGDEDSFGGAEADQASDEAVHIGSSDGVAGCIALSLDIDPVETEAIFVDDSIDTAVAGATELGGGILVTAAITHGHRQVDNQLLEEGGTVGKDALEQFIAQGGLQGRIGRVDLLFRRLPGRSVLDGSAGMLVSSAAAPSFL